MARAAPGNPSRWAVGDDAERAIALAVEAGADLPLPGAGATRERWQTLTDIARVDLTAARVLEAHADALAILAEAEAEAQIETQTEARTEVERPATGSWGVFAAEAPGVRLEATSGTDGITLTGTKPWCSLGGLLDHALVTAHCGDGTQRGLFAVDLRHAGVHAHPVTKWTARGLRAVPSTGIDFDGVPARPVGGPGWYLTRPGFAWGGAGVAACWYGGALGLADAVRAGASRRGDELAAMHLGAVDVALTGARCVLADAATEIDAGRADGEAGNLLALRVRGIIADAAERVLHTSGHALGPAPLAFDAAHAARAADLTMYVRQHHGERDLVTLGQTLLAGPSSPDR